MGLKVDKLFYSALIAGFLLSGSAQAEMKSTSYKIPSSVMDSIGMAKESTNYKLTDAIGQPTTIGVYSSNNYELKAGFLYDIEFSLSLEKSTSNVIAALSDILNDMSLELPKQETKSISQGIKFLEDALDALDLYEGGDADALSNALNKIKSAINKLISVDGVNTDVYQKMLAQAAEVIVSSEINTIAGEIGNSNPGIIQSRIFLLEGQDEVLVELYDGAVQSFVQAYNEALFAAL